MKKLVVSFIMIVCLTSMLSVTAFAAETPVREVPRLEDIVSVVLWVNPDSEDNAAADSATSLRIIHTYTKEWIRNQWDSNFHTSVHWTETYLGEPASGTLYLQKVVINYYKGEIYDYDGYYKGTMFVNL